MTNTWEKRETREKLKIRITLHTLVNKPKLYFFIEYKFQLHSVLRSVERIGDKL